MVLTMRTNSSIARDTGAVSTKIGGLGGGPNAPGDVDDVLAVVDRQRVLRDAELETFADVELIYTNEDSISIVPSLKTVTL